MVSFEWKKVNSTVSIIETKKKFFDSYYYNIKYFCPGGRIIHNDENLDLFQITKAIEDRLEIRRHYNYGGSWRAAKERINQIDPVQLLDMHTIKKRYGNSVRLRVEEPYVTIYSADEPMLFEISNQLKSWAHHLIRVSRPKDDAHKALLDNGVIIAKKDIGYKYKFVCKDGVCTNKSSLGSYLHQLGDQVKVSKAVNHMLCRDGNFIWGVWFYANDPNIANMLNIIEPNFVSNIHEVVVT